MTKDLINHPEHYTQGKVECIDAIEAATLDLAGIEAVCTGNAIKYLWRWKHKNGVEDLRKAAWYLRKLIDGVLGSEDVSGDESERCEEDPPVKRRCISCGDLLDDPRGYMCDLCEEAD